MFDLELPKIKVLSFIVLIIVTTFLVFHAINNIGFSKFWQGIQLDNDRAVHEYCIRRANTMPNYLNCVNEIQGKDI